MINVVSYLQSVPFKNSNEQKTQLLKHFINGVNKCNDNGILHPGSNIIDSDVAVIQGWVHQNYSTPHLKLRKNIIDTQRQSNKYTVAADANLFLYSDPANKLGYLRYSFNGIFPSTGIYCDDIIDPKRWNQISHDTGITLEQNKRSGNHILLMLQRQGGWSMGSDDVEKWAIRNIKKIRQYSDRPIKIRPHPGDKSVKKYLNPNQTRISKFNNVEIDFETKTLEDALINAWAVVNNNSSSVVGPIIKGYPAFITDPENSQCAEVSNLDFSKIENPDQFDRQKWLERISMFHWKFSELEDGSCWKHMRKYVTI